MNRSFTKKRLIQESNQILENRYLNEQSDDIINCIASKIRVNREEIQNLQPCVAFASNPTTENGNKCIEAFKPIAFDQFKSLEIDITNPQKSILGLTDALNAAIKCVTNSAMK